MKQTIVCHTRVRDGEPQHATTITVDWSGISDDQLRAGYLASMIIKMQGQWRRAGKIPARVDVRAADFAPGARVQMAKPTKESLRATYTRDELIAMLRELESESV